MCGQQFEVCKVVVVQDGVDVHMLGQVCGTTCMVALDLKPEHPVEPSQVSYLKLLAEAVNELVDELVTACSDHAVIDMDHNHCEGIQLLISLVEDGLVNGTLLEAEGSKDRLQLLIPVPARLLQAIQCLQEVQHKVPNALCLVARGMLHVQHLVIIEHTVQVSPLYVHLMELQV